MDDAVKLRLNDSSNESLITIPDFVESKCEQFGDLTPFLYAKYKNRWRVWSYDEFYSDVVRVAKALIELGLERFQSVCIASFNSPEWFITAVATIFAGGISNGLYLTNATETNKHILNDCKAAIVACQDAEIAEQMNAIKSNVPSLKRLVQFSGDAINEDVLTFESLLQMGERLSNENLEKRRREISVNECAVLVYTSGTTGAPKGVMLSHDNVIVTAKTICRLQKHQLKSEVVLSYLPLNHVAAFFHDIFVSLDCGGSVYFPSCGSHVLRGQENLINSLRESRPTRIFAPPRIWEKLQTSLEKNREWDSVGLGRIRGCYTAGAEISPDTLSFFHDKVGIHIRGAYGMSETTGVHVFVLAIEDEESRNDLPSNCVGKPIMGKSMIVNDELLMWGRNVMMGLLT